MNLQKHLFIYKTNYPIERKITCYQFKKKKKATANDLQMLFYRFLGVTRKLSIISSLQNYQLVIKDYLVLKNQTFHYELNCWLQLKLQYSAESGQHDLAKWLFCISFKLMLSILTMPIYNICHNNYKHN